MANQTLTTGTPSSRVNFDSSTLAGLANGETITIDGGHLLIDGDNRWGSNAAVFDTIANSATLGGTVRFDATQTWEVPFSASTGNVPTVADAGSNAITGTGITGELLRVWATGSLTPSAAGGSMPTTGLVKLRSKTGTFSNGLVVTLPGGATITCSGAGKRSWIHVVGEEAGSLNITRLGNATARGDYYDLGTTNGSDDQTFQFPVADACPVIFVETSAGSGVYEEWLNAGDRWGTATQFVSTDVRGKYFGQVNSTGVITIARRATNSCGYKPATGCNVRIPNIIMSSSTSADWNVNTINTTVASRYETITTSAGVIDLENVSCNWYINTSSAYSVSLKYSGFLQVVNITNTATTNTLVDVGVGLNAAQVSQAITIGNSSNSSTLTNVRAARYSATGANQYALQVIDSNNVTLTDVQGEMFGDTTTVARNNANISAINMTRCLGVVSDRFTAIGGRVQLVTCADVTFNDTRYADIINGTTTTIQAISAIDLSQSGSNNRFNGFSYFGGLTDVHPYSNTFLLATGMEGTIIENIGTADSPISLGSTNATGTLISASASYNSIVRRCYCVNTRTQPLIFANSTDSTVIDNVWGDEADTSVISGNNLTARGCRWINTTTGQNAVYGRHWEDAFTSTTAGRLVISCNEPTAATADQCAITAGTPQFTSTGSVSMPTIGDQVTWTMPYYMLGVTSLANIAPTLTGTNTGNFTMEFQWDTGSGFSAWTALTGANLSAVGAITPATGVKLKVRATTASASTTNALTYIRIDTVTNSTDRKIQYALPTDAVATISGITANSRVIVHNETDDILLYDAICPTTTLTIPYYSGVSAGAGDAIKVYALFYNTVDGSTASKKATALATATATGFSAQLDMQTCSVYGDYYTTYGTTGAAVYASGDFVRDQANVQIDLDDADNTWYGHRLFMFDKYDLYINAGRRASFLRVSAPDSGNINLGGIHLDNLNTATAKQGDNINLYNDDGILPVENPTTGGGGITMYSGGKILTTTTGGIAPSEAQIKQWTREEIERVGGMLALTKAKTDQLTFTGTNVNSDVVAISSDTAAADNLEAQFDGTGLTGTSYPATQDQVSNIAIAGAAVNTIATGFVLTTGVQTVNTYTATHALDGVRHTITDSAGTLDCYYTFNLGGDGIPAGLKTTGALTGSNDSLRVYAYNWITSAWDQIGTRTGTTSSANVVASYDLYTSHVGTGANIGDVHIRFQNTGLTTATLFMDQVLVSYSISATGIANGSTVTLNQSTINKSLEGHGWRLALGGQVISGSYFHGSVDISGTATSDVSLPPVFEDSAISDVSLSASCFMARCLFTDADPVIFTSTSGVAVDSVNLIDCASAVAGTGSPYFDLSGATKTTSLSSRRWSGGLKVELNSFCTVSVDVVSGGNIRVLGTGGSIAIRGTCTVVDESGGLVAITDTSVINRLTIAEAARDIVDQGTAQGSGSGNAQIQLAATASSSDGTYDPALIVITGGTGYGQSRMILQYVGSTRTATVSRSWKVIPDSTSEYIVVSHDNLSSVNEGLLQSATTNTVTLNANASDTDDCYAGQIIWIRGGTGEDQAKLCIAYNGTTKVATVDGTWGETPDGTSAYMVMPSSPVILAGVTHTGAVIPTVSALTGYVAPDNAGISANGDAIAALGTPLQVGDYTAPDNAGISANGAAIAALNDFDPAVDVVARVTLADTVTTLTNAPASVTAQQVWEYGTRTITAGGITLAEIEGSTVLAKEATVASKASQASVDGLDSRLPSDPATEASLEIINVGVQKASRIMPHSTNLT